MSSRTAAGTVRAVLAEVAKALAHEHRVELIEQLAQGPRSVEPLAQRVGLTVANASPHLQLRHAGLVTTQRDGKQWQARTSPTGVRCSSISRGIGLLAKPNTRLIT